MYKEPDHFTAITQEPICKYFGSCGGCSIQNISNHAEYKFLLLKQSLKSINFNGNLHKLEQISLHSRRRTTFKIHNNKLSFHKSRSKEKVLIENCPLLEESINNLIYPINQLIKNSRIKIEAISITSSDTGIEIIFHSMKQNILDMDIALTEFARKYDIARIAWQINKQDPHIIIQFKKLSLKFNDIYIDLPLGGFLQVSKESNHIMNEIILSHLKKTKNILELYCGCGSFTISISSKASITALEGNSSAVDSLKKTTKEYNLPIKVIKQDLYQTPYPTDKIEYYSQVVINPPRNGAGPQIKQIANTKLVEKVILISCSLENFIRDARILINGNFNLTNIYPIDQFLYSSHLEIIGIFEK